MRRAKEAFSFLTAVKRDSFRCGGKNKNEDVVLKNITRSDADCFDALLGVLFLIKAEMNLKDIFSFEHLVAAHKLSRLNKQHKRGTIMFELGLGVSLPLLVQELVCKKYKLPAYKAFKIYDPKLRLIEALPYKDRVVLMCFCKNSLEPRLIYDNAASRRGKGTEFSLDRLRGFMTNLYINNGHNNAYFLKCDISKYFQNINHDILLSKLKKCGFSEDELWFMELVIKSHGNQGVPLGNQTSQWFALLYLNDLDRFIKEKLRVRYYIRYMDDFVLLSDDKEFLQKCRHEIDRFCTDQLRLRLNQKTQIGRLKDGVDFLGFNHKLTPQGAVLKTMRSSARRRQNRYLRTISACYMKGIIDDDYLETRKASFVGHLKGTPQKKYVVNKINALRCQKRKIDK